MRASGDEKRALQGLIQLAAAYHHASRGRAAPAARLRDLAREKLGERTPLTTLHGADLLALRALLDAGGGEPALRAFFAALSAGKDAGGARGDGGHEARVDTPVA